MQAALLAHRIFVLRSAYDFRSVTREGNVAVAEGVALLVGGTRLPCQGGNQRARVAGRGGGGGASELRSICALTLIHTNGWNRKIRLHLLCAFDKHVACVRVIVG